MSLILFRSIIRCTCDVQPVPALLNPQLWKVKFPSNSHALPDDPGSMALLCRKGFYFLYYLQTVAGGDEPFEAFMQKYLSDFAHGNVDSEAFKARQC